LFKRLRFSRRRLLVVIFVVVLVWLAVCGGMVALAMSVGDQNNAQQSDVIVVLGSGLRRDGRAGDALWRRSLVAAQAYHNGLAPNIICTGGVGENQNRSEAEVCREILIGEDVPTIAIVLEENSRSTEENALNTRAIMAERGWTTAVVVTDSFHMLRAGWIFSGYGIEHTRYPVPRNRVRIWWYGSSLAREIAAIHWYGFKRLFNIEATDFVF
jgi:uncharacterized SAM-binding protein YcdF (DUF218 family)